MNKLLGHVVKWVIISLIYFCIVVRVQRVKNYFSSSNVAEFVNFSILVFRFDVLGPGTHKRVSAMESFFLPLLVDGTQIGGV